MSYQRYGYPLHYFKTGKSESYVFLHCGYNGDSEPFMEDYKDKYNDDKSFVELIGNIIEHETTSEYALKIVNVLSKKLGIDSELKILYKEKGGEE